MDTDVRREKEWTVLGRARSMNQKVSPAGYKLSLLSDNKRNEEWCIVGTAVLPDLSNIVWADLHAS